MGTPRIPHDSGTKGEPLQQRLERLGQIVVSEVEAWEQATRGHRTEALDKLTQTVERKISAAFEKQQSRIERQEARREAKRRAREERHQASASVPGGIVFLVAALSFALFAALRPDLWWMIFVALGTGLSGARMLQAAGQRRHAQKLAAKAEAPAALPVEVAPPVVPHQVDELCDALLADLKVAPDAVRNFVQNPEATVESLRRTAHALDERRGQLLAEVPESRFKRLQQQRDELELRRATVTDAQAQKRLSDALTSLDNQKASLDQLKRAAERVDGEYTSLLVLLQELRTRVTVARTAGSDVQLEGLKASVGRLNDELSAITEAMEAVQQGTLAPVVDVTNESETPLAPQTSRERS